MMLTSEQQCAAASEAWSNREFDRIHEGAWEEDNFELLANRHKQERIEQHALLLTAYVGDAGDVKYPWGHDPARITTKSAADFVDEYAFEAEAVTALRQEAHRLTAVGAPDSERLAAWDRYDDAVIALAAQEAARIEANHGRFDYIDRVPHEVVERADEVMASMRNDWEVIAAVVFVALMIGLMFIGFPVNGVAA
ncbi:hypothetical protein [Kerstersia gyiorum]|uniref:hypothetical protein n=1 Tax=Kerstersia gyiorum TaxID=206506 RepID=UPI00209F8D95|nr:hypothetical protein [Kerstersia gyiorum]MCP1679443.1 hypothetical protein [Kerstersia gyiorum]MCP1823946.1 hypothetical protein [Kerstersia gyiorum]MCP1827387.1 hypothetical protein [Kerstersia gyiorum]MCW2448964.1 hypothetical protein [Kerstersia gyiorum]